MMNLPRTPVQRRGKAAPIKSEQPNEKELIERLRRFEMFEPLPVAILKTARIQLHRSGERLWTKASPTSGVSNRHPVPKIRVHSKAWVDENLTRPRIVIQANDRNPHARLPGRDHDFPGRYLPVSKPNAYCFIFFQSVVRDMPNRRAASARLPALSRKALASISRSCSPDSTGAR